MRALNVLLAVLVSLVLALAVFEVGLRFVPRSPFQPIHTINEFDADLGWSKRPNAEIERDTGELDISIETNAHGLRDDATASPEKPANTFRTLMLGDSFVLGYTVDRDDLFVDHLERWWNEEERRVDVVNAGTEGYSTDQEVLWFQKHGKGYRPDLVLLFPYENDIFWNGEATYTRFPKPRFEPDGTLEERTLVDPGPASWLSRFAIGRFLETQILSRLRRSSGPPPNHFRPDGSDRYVYSEFAPLLLDPPGFVDEALARTRGALKALDASCEEIGARLIVVPIPSESAIHEFERTKFQEQALAGVPADAWSPDRPVDLFLGMAEELGIETLDPRSTLRAYAKGSGEALYFDGEWHFNPLGNHVFAEFLHDELAAKRVFPEAHSARRETERAALAPERGVPTWLKFFAALWAVLGTSYALTYRDESAPLGFLKVGGLLGVVFAIFFGARALIRSMNPLFAPIAAGAFVLLVLGFVAYKLGGRLGTIAELLKSFTLRGHWYLIPLVTVLLTIGSLLVVAASSPLIAPFIYTLF